MVMDRWETNGMELQHDEQGYVVGSTPTDDLLVENQNECCAGCSNHVSFTRGHRVDDYIVCTPCYRRYTFGEE
jgi:formylmethanofuran dehydrogenase subunit E